MATTPGPLGYSSGEIRRGSANILIRPFAEQRRTPKKYLTAKLREKDLGVFVEPASMAVETYLEGWLEDVAQFRVRERTFDSYRGTLNLYILPKLGSKKLCDLTTFEIQKVYREMQSSGLSPRTIRYAHAILSSALKHAVKTSILVQNPCDQCELPRQVRAEMKCFTPDETVRFLDAAKTSKWYCLFLLAIETGLRPEEYLGLQWKDVDFENSSLSVRRAVFYLRGSFRFSEPKTAKSRRSLTLSASLVMALKSHKRNQLEARMKLAPSIRISI